MQPAVIGPFVGPNGLENKIEPEIHLGCSLEWASRDHHFVWDLVLKENGNLGDADATFSQRSDVSLSDLFQHAFFELSRLFEIVEELGRQATRLGARKTPLPAKASRWLSPVYAEAGFALTIPRATRAGAKATLVWRPPRGLRKDFYTGIAALVWTDGQAYLRDSGDIPHEAFASQPLRERFLRLMAKSRCPILSAEGNERMRSLVEAFQGTRPPGSRLPVAAEADLELAAAVRRDVLRGRRITSAQVSASRNPAVVRRLFLWLLKRAKDEDCAALAASPGFTSKLAGRFFRTCVRRGLTAAARALFGQCERKDVLSAELPPCLPLDLAVLSGSKAMLAWCLEAFAPLDLGTLSSALRTALDLGDEGAADLATLAAAANVDPGDRWVALGRAFEDAMYAFEGEPFSIQPCLRLLKLGYLPFDEVGWPRGASRCATRDALPDLLAPDQPRCLEAIFEHDPPTHENLERLLLRHANYENSALGYLLDRSRALPLHARRLDRWMLQLAAGYVRMRPGELGRVTREEMMHLAIAEGARLESVGPADLSALGLLRGRRWHEEQDNLITLIQNLKQYGHHAQARVLAGIRRRPAGKRGCGGA